MVSERNVSLWEGTTPETSYPSLSGTISVDVAVVGGGITGLTTAYLLKEAGVSVAVLEARRIATGTTGRTTAKVTSLHGLIYADLVSRFREEGARLYGEANERAIAEVARVVAVNSIECDFTRMPAYTYTESQEAIPQIEAEVEASLRLGLPATYARDVPLPYDVRGAIRFDHQALFHPRKYCLALGALVDGGGSRLFEGSRAKHVEQRDGRYEVATDGGAVVAGHVVIATLLPFHDPGGFFAKTHPSRSYALARRIDGGPLDGMFLSADSPTRSVRPHLGDGQAFLVVEGEEHKTGQDPEAQRHYDAIEQWARERFGVDTIDYRWSAQDYIPADGVPYVGRMPGGAERVLVATGFKKWGMSNGTAAAMMLRDVVLDRPNPWLSLFDATRLRPRQSAPSLVKENVNVARRSIGDRVARTPSLPELGNGEGAVIDHDGERLAVYRASDGNVHALSARCTHMGCIVSFNPRREQLGLPLPRVALRSRRTGDRGACGTRPRAQGGRGPLAAGRRGRSRRVIRSR